jgi:predicted CxxxxCH...CXXCH cytochrome family protein
MPETAIYDKNIQIGFNVFNAYLGGTYDGRILPLVNGYGYEAGNPQTTITNAGLMECSGIYCHGATMDPNGGTDITPVWDDPTTAQCGTCHGATASAFPTRGGHMKHAREFLEGYNYACDFCHADPATDDSLHVNNRSEVIFSSIPMTNGGSYGGTSSMLDAYGTCSNVYCHSTVQSSPPGSGPTYKTTYAWGEPISLGCGSCHGYFDGTPPSTLVSGSHEKHFEYYWGFSADCFPCHNYNNAPDAHGACHAGGGFGSPQRDRHADYTIDVALSPPYGGSYSGSLTPGVGYGTCSNVYCHGSSMDPNGGTDVTPDWGDSTTGQCGTCHGATILNPPLLGSHPAHKQGFLVVYNYDCGLCHKDPNSDNSLHVDNKSQVVFSNDPKTTGGSYNGTDAMLDSYGTCTNVYCHSSVQSSPPGSGPTYRITPSWGTDSSGCERCHDYSDSIPELSTGSHQPHIQTYPMDQCFPCHNYYDTDDPCFSCHDGSGEAPGDQHANYTIDVAFAPSYGGTYSGSSVPDVNYGDCSNVYCHGNYNGSGRNATPSWSNASTGACNTCHGAANTDIDKPASGSHEKHVDSDQTINAAPQATFNRNYDCTLCHTGIVDGSGQSGYTIIDATKHANTTVDWAFDASDQRLVIGTPSYSITTGTLGPSDGTIPRAYGTCIVYCHSNVQPEGGTGAPDAYIAPTWGSTINCGNCHGRDSHSAIGNVISSGSHTDHLAYEFTTPGTYKKCDICHKMGTADINVDECNSCHVGDERTRHVDGEVNVIFDTSFVGNSAAYSDPTGTPGNGYFDCTNTYCHSNGASVSTGTIPANTSPVWGSATLACDSCHGYPPSYSAGSPKANSHTVTEHLAFGCQFCHSSTSNDGVTISSTTLHVNKIYDVVPGGGESFTYTFSPAGGTCDIVSCHGGGSETW